MFVGEDLPEHSNTADNIWYQSVEDSQNVTSIVGADVVSNLYQIRMHGRSTGNDNLGGTSVSIDGSHITMTFTDTQCSTLPISFTLSGLTLLATSHPRAQVTGTLDTTIKNAVQGCYDIQPYTYTVSQSTSGNSMTILVTKTKGGFPPPS